MTCNYGTYKKVPNVAEIFSLFHSVLQCSYNWRSFVSFRVQVLKGLQNTIENLAKELAQIKKIEASSRADVIHARAEVASLKKQVFIYLNSFRTVSIYFFTLILDGQYFQVSNHTYRGSCLFCIVSSLFREFWGQFLKARLA